jgi:hypothetical protein
MQFSFQFLTLNILSGSRDIGVEITKIFGVAMGREFLVRRFAHALRMASRQRGYSRRIDDMTSHLGRSDHTQTDWPLASSSRSSQVIPQLIWRMWRGGGFISSSFSTTRFVGWAGWFSWLFLVREIFITQKRCR